MGKETKLHRMVNVVNLCKYCKKNEIDLSRSKVGCSVCIDKNKQRKNEWAKNNREKLNSKSKQYYKEHKDQKSDYDKEYRRNNKDKIDAKAKHWREENRERQIEKSREYRLQNKEKVRSGKRKCWYAKHEHYLNKAKEWRKNNLERSNEIIRKSTLNRRAKKLNNGGMFTLDEWEEIKKKYNYQCVCCGKTNISLEVDHVIPLSLGGINNIENIQPLCRSCNARKHTKIIDYRLQYDMIIDWT